jgi:hypothetical protein
MQNTIKELKDVLLSRFGTVDVGTESRGWMVDESSINFVDTLIFF